MENSVVDLFTSRINHQLPQYIAWRPDPLCQGTDAMYHDWSKDYLYAFPPFGHISRILTESKARKKAKHVVDNTNMTHSTLVSIPSSNVNRNH